jgi:hypothetical protein
VLQRAAATWELVCGSWRFVQLGPCSAHLHAHGSNLLQEKHTWGGCDLRWFLCDVARKQSNSNVQHTLKLPQPCSAQLALRTSTLMWAPPSAVPHPASCASPLSMRACAHTQR